MAWTGLALTVDGQNALNNAQLSGRMQIKSIVVGDGATPANFRTLKELVHQLYEVTDLMVEKTDAGCTLTVELPQVEYDYYFREIGVIASTDDGDKLYVYDNCGDDAQYIVSTTGVEVTKKRIKISLGISDVAEVTVVAPSLLYVAYDDFNGAVEEIKEEISSLTPQDVGAFPAMDGIEYDADEGSLRPVEGGTQGLGDAGHRWKEAFINTIRGNVEWSGWNDEWTTLTSAPTGMYVINHDKLKQITDTPFELNSNGRAYLIKTGYNDENVMILFSSRGKSWIKYQYVSWSGWQEFGSMQVKYVYNAKESDCNENGIYFCNYSLDSTDSNWLPGSETTWIVTTIIVGPPYISAYARLQYAVPFKNMLEIYTRTYGAFADEWNNWMIASYYSKEWLSSDDSLKLSLVNDSPPASNIIDILVHTMYNGQPSAQLASRTEVRKYLGTPLVAQDANGYFGLANPAGDDTVYIRTTVSGIIPHRKGTTLSDVVGSIGTSSWKFATSWILLMQTNRIDIGDYGTVKISNASINGMVLQIVQSGSTIEEALWFQTFNSYSSFRPSTNSLCDLGRSDLKFRNIYASNGTIQTSDRTKKKNIKPLSEQLSHNFIMGLAAIIYQLIDGTSGRYHWGMIAQDVEELMTNLGMTSLDFAGLIKSPRVREIKVETEVEVEEDVNVADENGNHHMEKRLVKKQSTKTELEPIPGEYDYALRYEEFIAPIITVEQIHDRRLEDMQHQIDALRTENEALKRENQIMLDRLARIEAAMGI